MPRLREPLDAQQLPAACDLPARILVWYVAVRHHLNELADGDVAQRARRDVPAVPQDRDPVANPEHLVHAMRDVHDGHAASDQSSGGRKELLDLYTGECGCRLVHHEYAGLIGQGPRELHHLLLRETELAGRPSHVDRQTQPAEQTFGLVPHPTPVDEAPPARRLSEEDVLRDRQTRNQRQLLIDDADAQPTGVIGTRDLYTLAREHDLSGILGGRAAQDFHEGGLARAVLAEQHVHFTRLELQ